MNRHLTIVIGTQIATMLAAAVVLVAVAHAVDYFVMSRDWRRAE